MDEAGSPEDVASLDYNIEHWSEETLTEGKPHHFENKNRQYLPIIIFTAIYGLIFIIAPLLVRQGPNRSITRVCIMLSTFCCWIFWTTTYIVQMNPLLGPRVSNRTLAWIGHKWGKDPVVLQRLLGSNNTNINGSLRIGEIYEADDSADLYDAEGDSAAEYSE